MGPLALAGIAGLALLGNPLKRMFKGKAAKRRNPKRRGRNPFAKGPILKGAELPKGVRKGQVFHLAGVKYLVMHRRIRRGKRIVRQRIARPVTGVHRI